MIIYSYLDGYENQEAELIGEGPLTAVYKTMTGDNQSIPMAFKVFKVRIIHILVTIDFHQDFQF